MNNAPWLRKLVVTIGPLSGNTISVVSDGTTNTLRVIVNVNKTIMGVPMPSKIQIYNLSAATRRALHTAFSKGSIVDIAKANAFTQVTISAGWQNTPLEKLFQGGILTCYTERQGADLITTIMALQGVGQLTTTPVSVSFTEGFPVATIAKALAEQIPGLTLGDVKGLDAVIGKGGWAREGSAKDVLTALASEYGFSWSIEDNKLNFLGDKTQFSGLLEISGDGGSLMSVNPILNGPMQMQVGVNIKAVYTPGARPGTTVRLRSGVMPTLNSDYMIHTATFALDCFSDSWTMDIESFAFYTGSGAGFDNGGQ